MTSLDIAEFKHTIIEFTNTKDFPLEVKRLVFFDILKGLSEATEKEINDELKERRDKEENSKKKGDNK